jgi:hypothetical protein
MLYSIGTAHEKEYLHGAPDHQRHLETGKQQISFGHFPRIWDHSTDILSVENQIHNYGGFPTQALEGIVGRSIAVYAHRFGADAAHQSA